MKKLNKKNIIYILLIIITSLFFSLSLYLNQYFTSTNLEQLLYNILNITATFNTNFMEKSINTVLTSFIVLSISILLPIIVQTLLKMEWNIKIKNKTFKIFPISLKKYSIFFLIVSSLIITIQLKVPAFIKNQLSSSTIYEDYYVSYDKENVTFPEKKQNLIMIYVESLEVSGFNIENGGTTEESYMPRLESLALEHINFSNTDKIGGFKTINGTNWTVAGLVAQTSGVPISIKTTNSKDNFLEGVTSLGDILEENGYKNYLSIGSDINYGDRNKYFEQHGNYTIYDYNYTIDNQEIPNDYFEWWGYEDRKLYEFSKQRLIQAAKEGEPFNFTMLTADTHFFSGYTADTCTIKFNDPYANSYYCTDSMLVSFINWIKEQDFYKNTTIVIAGDHLTMRDDFYQISDNYQRTVFNLFINSQATTTNTTNRDFTAMDMFPTTLASLGVEIKNNKLGLGTNLFSNEKTLSEEIGHENLNKELQKKSTYYKENILK